MAHKITLNDSNIKNQLQISAEAFLAETSQIIGQVSVKEQASIWYQCVLRGDVMPIEIGKKSNIQDGTVVHGTYKKCGVTVGESVTVGHSCILHGCRLDDFSFVGMGSIIMDEAHVVSKSMVGAGSLVTEKTVTKEGWLYLGRPAKAIRPLTPEELSFIEISANNYVNYTKWYKEPK